MYRNPLLRLFFGLIMLLQCGNLSCQRPEKVQNIPKSKPLSYDPPGSTDTRDRIIQHQLRRTFRLNQGGISFSNEFTGARLNAVDSLGENYFRLVIAPENQPINNSPWFGFKVWSKQPQIVRLQLAYTDAKHRYLPKLSRDGKNWRTVIAEEFKNNGRYGELTLTIDEEPLWVSAQELHTSAAGSEWLAQLAQKHNLLVDTAGYSHLGKPIEVLHAGDTTSDYLLVFLGRQHPPEVSGYLAYQSFAEELLGSNSAEAKAFRSKFHMLHFPNLNPDGVDLGHWRHNGVGVDLNRDWELFLQPETRALRDYVNAVMVGKKELSFGMDFHSTQQDMFYMYNEEMKTKYFGFGPAFIDAIKEEISDFNPYTEATGYNSSSAKLWFYDVHKAEFMTYEVGDETNREDVEERGAAAARVLFTLLPAHVFKAEE